MRNYIAHQVADSSQGHFVGNGDVKAAFQLYDNIYNIDRVETQLAAEVATDTQALRLNGLALADDTQYLLLNGF